MLSTEGVLVVAVNDIVSFGGDRGPRRPGWRRWRPVAVAACGIAALAAAFIWYLPGSRHHGGGQARPAAALSPGPTAREVVIPPIGVPMRPSPAKPTLVGITASPAR